MPTLIATEVTLTQLRERFGLVRSPDLNFFGAELGPLSETTAAEQTMLDRVQQNYLSQFEAQSLNEETVKMVVVSPLLDLAGFYRSPFTIDSEVSVALEEIDESGVALTGRIDTLIIRNQLWVLVVESKRARFSVQAAIPQALAYLLARPGGRSGYALLTNGGEFLLVRLAEVGVPTYGFSETFSLWNQGNDLNRVLGVLRQITVVA
jgi:predicted type IV restriction endonuclease